MPAHLATDLDPAAPPKPTIDWADAAERLAALRPFVGAARAALALIDPQTQDAAPRAAAALLATMGAKAQAPGSAPREARPGETAAIRRRQGVAPDRRLRVVDPQMRWGHKSSQQRWAGYKVPVAAEVTSELITDVGVRIASAHDAVPLGEHVTRQEEAVGLRPAAVLTDGAFGTADARADVGALGVAVVAQLRPLTDQKHIGKDEFVIDLAANGGQGSVTGPAGVTTLDRRRARDKGNRPVPLFRFPREVCIVCPLQERCLGGAVGRVAHPVRPPPGRQVQLHFHEAVLQQARAAQRTPEQRRALRERLRPRAKVERKMAELMRRHGLRQGRYQGRYLGLLKTEFPAC